MLHLYLYSFLILKRLVASVCVHCSTTGSPPSVFLRYLTQPSIVGSHRAILSSECNGMKSKCSLIDGITVKLNYFSFHVHLNLLEAAPRRGGSMVCVTGLGDK